MSADELLTQPQASREDASNENMKTPHSTLYRYTAETVAAANRIPNSCVNEMAHKVGMERGEPVIVMLDSLIKYAEAYRIRFESALADDPILGDQWLAALTAAKGLLDGDGALAMKFGHTTDSKDNSACEQMFEDALNLAGFNRAELGI